MVTLGRFVATWFCLAAGAGFCGGQPLAEEGGEDGVGGKLIQRLPREDQNSPVASFRIALAPANAQAGEMVTLAVSANLQRGWHVYPLELASDVVGVPTQLAISAQGVEPLGELEFQGPIRNASPAHAVGRVSTA